MTPEETTPDNWNKSQDGRSCILLVLLLRQFTQGTPNATTRSVTKFYNSQQIIEEPYCGGSRGESGDSAGERDPANANYPPYSLGSASETPGQDTMRPKEAELGTQSQANGVSEKSDSNPPASVDRTNQQMLLEFFASVTADLSTHREDIQAQFTSVKADLSANQENLRAELQSNQTKLELLQESVRSDLSRHREDINLY